MSLVFKVTTIVAALLPLTLAATAPNCSANVFPTQIRLAYAGHGGMAVSWNTKQQLTSPTVFYGTTSGNLSLQASSSVSVTYPSSSTWNNHVTITGLGSNATFYYMPQCGNETFTATTAPNPVTCPVGGFQFAMIGDMGTFGPLGLSTTVGSGAANPLGPGDNTTIQSLMARKGQYEFVWHVGDIAYADSWVKEEQGNYIKPQNLTDNGAVYDKILNAFYDEVEGISENTPYMVAVGNHEANCDNGSNLTICVPGQLNFTGYRAHWNMPSQSSGGLENFWYSFDYGMVHFITFNTETDFPNAPDEPGGEGAENGGPFAPNGTQLAWLEKDLASVDRTKTPWIIVGGHRPWYVSTTACTECQAAFEPLFIKYGVDLVLHGHKHFYERQAAIAKGVAQEIGNSPTAPWYIVNGAAGHYDGLDTPTSPYVSTSRKLIVAYGWSLFTVHNATHLTTQFISSSNNTVMDTATLYKNRSNTALSTCSTKSGANVIGSSAFAMLVAVAASLAAVFL